MSTFKFGKPYIRRMVFKIDVGNISDADIEVYIQRIANKFRNVPIVDENTGQINRQFDPLDFDADYFLPGGNLSNMVIIDHISLLTP